MTLLQLYSGLNYEITTHCLYNIWINTDKK